MDTESHQLSMKNISRAGLVYRPCFLSSVQFLSFDRFLYLTPETIISITVPSCAHTQIHFNHPGSLAGVKLQLPFLADIPSNPVQPSTSF